MFPEGRALEFLIAAVLALIIIGPKDLPLLLRKLGQFMARVRAMAAEFRASFDEMARQSELDELRKEVEAMRKAQMSDIAKLAGAPEVTQTFEDLSQGLTDVGVDLNSPSHPYAFAQTETVDIEEVVKTPRKRTPKTGAKTAARSGKATAAKAAAKPAVKPGTAKAKPSASKAKTAAAKPTAARRRTVEGTPTSGPDGTVS